MVLPVGGVGLPVGVAGDLVAHHHTVHQPLGQQASVVVTKLSRSQLPQVLALHTQRGGVSQHNGEEESQSTQRGGVSLHNEEESQSTTRGGVAVYTTRRSRSLHNEEEES